MPVGRDWAWDLRPASFRGVFFFQAEDGIRDLLRQAVHEIPNGSWTVERLGPGAGEITIRGYVASSRADIEAAALSATFKDDRPGLLVLPMVGPVQVSPLELSRDRSSSKHGYVSLSMRFVVSPPRQAGVSVDYLANLVFTASAGLLGTAVQQIATMLQTVSTAAYVVDAAIGSFAGVVAAVDQVRAASRSTASADVAMTLTRLGFRTAEVAEDDRRAELLTELTTAAVDLADGMDPASVAGGFRPLRSLVAAVPDSAAASDVAAAANASALASLARISALCVEAEAIARTSYADRDGAEAARTNFAARAGAESEAIVAVVQSAGRRPAASSVVTGLAELQRAVVDYLGTAALDLAPRVTVETNQSLPALVWAWTLYADPARAGELRRFNRVPRPAFMPTRFRALAPTVTIGRGP
mgnify:FL=1